MVFLGGGDCHRSDAFSKSHIRFPSKLHKMTMEKLRVSRLGWGQGGIAPLWGMATYDGQVMGYGHIR
jgi:hypothetical protein